MQAHQVDASRASSQQLHAPSSIHASLRPPRIQLSQRRSPGHDAGQRCAPHASGRQHRIGGIFSLDTTAGRHVHQQPRCRPRRLQCTAVYSAERGKNSKWVQVWHRAQQAFPILLYWDVIQRCAITILMLLVIRSGAFIPLPGVDMQHLPTFNLPATEGERMIRALYGQATELPASLFMLGISPFINASIIFTVLLALPPYLLDLPYFQRLREARKEGKGGEAYVNKSIYNTALIFAIYSAMLEVNTLAPHALFAKWFAVKTVLTLVAGSCVIHACAETITSSGIGNGTTLVICSYIITGYADTLHKLLTALESAALASWQVGFLAGGFLLMLGLVVIMNLTELRLKIVAYSSTIPEPTRQDGRPPNLLIQARLLSERRAAERGGPGAYLPILLNSTGMMPVIIASATFFGLPPALLRMVGRMDLLGGVVQAQSSGWGLLGYGLLVFALEFLPFGSIKPSEVAEYFSNISVGIKGWAPGQITEQNLDLLLKQCKFWGGILLAFVAIGAHWLDMISSYWLGTPLGTTNLLIIVGAVLQSARQLRALAEGPRLQQQLDKERRLIQGLAQM